MGFCKNHANSSNRKANRQSPRSGAYQPRSPFASVEGICSLGWDRLSPYAVWVLIEFYRKFNGYNRSNLCVTYAEVKGRIANGTYNKAIWELIGYGFLDVKRTGRLERNASVYAISDRWRGLQSEAQVEEIGALLRSADQATRMRTPRNLSPDEQKDFAMRRRTRIREIRKRLGGSQNMVKNLNGSSPGGAVPQELSPRGGAVPSKVTPPGAFDSSPRDVGNEDGADCHASE